MEILNNVRTIIGEGPVWNDKEQKLYYVNPYESEYRIIDVYTKETEYIKTDVPVSAIAFTDEGYVDVPAKIPANCTFAKKSMEKLIIVTANYKDIKKEDENAGFTLSHDHFAKGRKPFLFKTKEAK